MKREPRIEVCLVRGSLLAYDAVFFDLVEEQHTALLCRASIPPHRDEKADTLSRERLLQRIKRMAIVTLTWAGVLVWLMTLQ